MNNKFSVRDDLFLLQHPFYQAWVDGKLSKETLQDYACQYYHHVEAFPQYLRNAVSLCNQTEAKNILADNLAEEDGTRFGTSHPELWLKFANGVGVTSADVKAAAARKGIRHVVDTFTAFSLGSPSEALGSLYAYESQVPEIAQSKIDGLRQHFGIHDPETLSFFEVHRTADVEHRNTLKIMIDQLPEFEKQQAQNAADVSAQALWDFLSDIHQTNDGLCA